MDGDCGEGAWRAVDRWWSRVRSRTFKLMYAQEGDSQRCGRRWSLDRDALDLGFGIGIGIDKESGLAFAKYSDDNSTER